MANGNPTFNNAAMFVGAASEPDKQIGSSKMAQEETTPPTKKVTVKQLNEFIRRIVREALAERAKSTPKKK